MLGTAFQFRNKLRYALTGNAMYCHLDPEKTFMLFCMYMCIPGLKVPRDNVVM